MKAPESPRDPNDKPLVENEWKRILTDFGVAEGPADLLVAGVLGGPDIRRTNPSKEQLKTLVERNLSESALESKLDDPTQLEAVEELLMDALHEAIAGRYGGPASAPREIAYSGMNPPVGEGTETTDSTASSASAAEESAQGHSSPAATSTQRAPRARADAGRGAWDASSHSVFNVEVPSTFEALSDAEQELVEYLWEFIDTNDLDENELAKAAAFVAIHDKPENES